LLIGKVKARGVGEMIANVGGWSGASVVTSSAERDRVSRVRRAGMIVLCRYGR